MAVYLAKRIPNLKQRQSFFCATSLIEPVDKAAFSHRLFKTAGGVSLFLDAYTTTI
jgi:hypothetical protein